MLTALEWILSTVEAFGTLVLWGVETAINAGLAALAAAFAAAVALLPQLPEVVTPPRFIGYVNWFFPVGAVVTVATSMLSAYVVFLGLRWIFKKVGVI